MKKKSQKVPCTMCRVAVELYDQPKHRRYRYKKRGLAYCSEECMRKYLSEKSSRTMAATNRKYASERMKRNNPMARPESRAKMKTTLRAMGWKPQVRKGNGTGPTIHESALACALGWDIEVVVPTRARSRGGYPTCYKIDVASKELKVGVEIDGSSHCALERKAKDRKKQEFLESKGWTILRFTNQEVEGDLESCVQTVLSIISK